jgi:hypothetical protein
VVNDWLGRFIRLTYIVASSFSLLPNL